MKKFFITLFTLSLLFNFSMFSKIAKAKDYPKESGLMLDISRRFYAVDTIKKFIDEIHSAKGKFLHLHFADHENYALESTFLDQREENAVQKNSMYINPKTNKPFLTYKQLNEIINYAKSKKVEIVPEVDSPNHIGAILTLLTEKYGADYVKQFAINEDELDISNPKSIEMIKTLTSEVIDIFGSASKHFHIGGDEFSYNDDFIAYVNELNQFINHKGLTTRMWNDGLLKQNIDKLSKNIEITYWSFDGDAQEQQDIKQRRKERVSLPELLNKGFKVLNYNSYYLYFIPRDNGKIEGDTEFALKDLKKNWKLGKWDSNHQQGVISNTENIIGSAFSIWGEESGKLSDEVIYENTKDLLETIITKTNCAP